MVAAFDDAETRDLRELPGVERLERPGPWGTFPEHTEGSAPHAPTLSNGPLYTGEYREEVNGDVFTVPVGRVTILATLRRPWPWVGFAVDGSKIPGGQTVTFGLRVLLRSGSALVSASLLPAAVPGLSITGPPTAGMNGWQAMIGIAASARLELFALITAGAATRVRGTLWGCNAPGFGP